MKLLVPLYASENASVWVYPVTFGGGLVGGDRVHMTFTAKPRCCLVITGQESTKVSVVALLFSRAFYIVFGCFSGVLEIVVIRNPAYRGGQTKMAYFFLFKITYRNTN